MKNTKRNFLLTLAGLIFILILGLIASNAFDEPLRPEVTAILEERAPVSENGAKAFYFLLGLDAGAKDPEAQGKELWERDFAQGLLKPWSIPSPPPEASLKSNTGLPTNLDAETLEALKQARPYLDQYLRLLQFGELSNLPSPNPFGPAQSRASLLLTAHRWLSLHLQTLAAEGKWSEAEKLVRLENAFQSGFFSHTPVLQLMISHLILRENAQFLESELKAHPTWKLSPTTLATFKRPPPQDWIAQGLDQELRIFAKVSERFASGFPVALNAEEGPLFALQKVPYYFVFKTKQTVNRYYDFITELKQNPTQTAEVAAAWTQPAWPWQWLLNPFGRNLMRLFTVNITHRYETLLRFESELKERLSRLESRVAVKKP